MSESVMKPQPRVNQLTKHFWEGANHDKLYTQQCESVACRQYVFYPRVCCPYCQSPSLQWVEASGQGLIISNTTIHRPHHDGFLAQCPYVFAAIELAEGPCIYAKVIEAPVDVSLIGRAVRVEFELHGPNQKMPVFSLVNN
jgi:uncharacterized protein